MRSEGACPILDRIQQSMINPLYNPFALDKGSPKGCTLWYVAHSIWFRAGGPVTRFEIQPLPKDGPMNRMHKAFVNAMIGNGFKGISKSWFMTHGCILCQDHIMIRRDVSPIWIDTMENVIKDHFITHASCRGNNHSFREVFYSNITRWCPVSI